MDWGEGGRQRRAGYGIAEGRSLGIGRGLFKLLIKSHGFVEEVTTAAAAVAHIHTHGQACGGHAHLTRVLISHYFCFRHLGSWRSFVH